MNKILVISLTLCILCGCKKEKLRIEKIYDNSSYTIGILDKTVKVPMRTSLIYDYSINSISYNGKQKERGIGQDYGTYIGKQFLVVYDKDNPSESHLNLDFLIESQEDYQFPLAPAITNGVVFR